MMKEILQNRGLPVVEWMYVTCYDELDDRFLEKVNTLGYPLIVKPSGLGSSIAIQKVMDEDELRHALSEAFRYDEKVILERAVQNLKEINASVMGDLSSSEVSVLEEVVKADDILSYHDKYEGAKTKGMAGAAREIPARISVEQTIQIEELAKKTFRELHAKGIARIDFMMDEDTQTIYVNEINTIPGSLSFYLWEPKQLSFTKLLDELIDLGLRNYRRQQQRITSYSTNILQTFDPKNGNKLK